MNQDASLVEKKISRKQLALQNIYMYEKNLTGFKLVSIQSIVVW